jgi:chromosome partitioning protein
MSETLNQDSPQLEQERTSASAPKLPRVLALANQKGGVGKTTTAINLGTALAAIGEQVLILDLDPQGNASTGLGIDRRNRRCSTYHVMADDAPLRDAILATSVPRLQIAPATADLSGFDLEVGRSADRAFRLRRALQKLNGAPDDTAFSYVLIDCPPSLNLITINAMAAANAILVPLQCEFFALEGLSQLMKTVEQVKQSLNPDLIIHGIVLTMYDSRNNLSAQVVADVREFMGRKVYDTVIPRNVRISEAPSYGKPVLVYDLKCAGSEAYLRLATEIIQREKELLAAVPVAPAPAQPESTGDTASPVTQARPAAEVSPLPSYQTNARSSGNEQTGDQPQIHDQTTDQAEEPSKNSA